MRVYCVQYDIIWEDKEANFSRVRELLAGATPQPGSLIVLPEMFATGFSMNADEICEAPGGSTTLFLREIAKAYQSYIVGGLATEHTNDRRTNEALVLTPSGEELGRYAKVHPFTYGGEDTHYAAGDRIIVVDCGGLQCSPLVCYDLRFPESFREGARSGAALFVVITNWPTARMTHWSTLLRARAIENQAYVVGVNRCGADPNYEYLGHSLVIDPFGEILAEAGDSTCVIDASLDAKLVADYREKFPALKDMR